MFKPLTRHAKTSPPPSAGFAETQFVHHADDDDYSGFAPTQLFGDEDELRVVHAAASSARTALERAAAKGQVASEPATANEPALASSWSTSQWVAAQEARAHEAADQARAVIAAQRRAEEQVEAAAVETAPTALTAPRTGLGRLRAAFEKLLPGEFRSLLPLFVGVTATMAVISAVLPMIDRH